MSDGLSCETAGDVTERVSVILILSGAPSLAGCVVQLLGCHGYSGKTCAAKQPGFMRPLRSQMLLGSHLCAASWCPSPPHHPQNPGAQLLDGDSDQFSTSSTIKWLWSCPPTSYLLIMSFPIGSFFPFVWLPGAAFLQANGVSLFIIVTQSHPLCLSIPWSSCVVRLPLSHSHPPCIDCLCKYSSQLSHCLSASPSPACLFTMFRLLPSPLLLPLI